jgi:hypothetical protein
MVSEGDLSPIFHEDGEVIGPLETFPGPDSDPAEAHMAKDEAAEFEELKERCRTLLETDQMLKGLFGCLCAGIIKRRAIARKLGLKGNTIKNAQKRLACRIAGCNRHRN